MTDNISVPGDEQPTKEIVPQITGVTALLRPPLLLSDEDESGYNALLAAVSAAVKPSDILEEMPMHDVVYHQWHIQRLRRLMSAIINAGKRQALEAVLYPLLANDIAYPLEVHDLAEEYTKGDETTVQKVNDLMNEAGLTRDAVLAQGLATRIDVIERIDRMAMAAQACRDTALNGIDRRRQAFGKELRLAVREIEDAEFNVIEASPEHKEAA